MLRSICVAELNELTSNDDIEQITLNDRVHTPAQTADDSSLKFLSRLFRSPFNAFM